MKKIVLLLLFSTINIFSQEIELSIETGELKATSIVELDDLSKEEIYTKVLDWVAYSFTNTESVIQSQIENEMIRIKGITPTCLNGLVGMYYDFHYQIQIDIKDDRFRFVVSNLGVSSGGGVQTASLREYMYKKNGKKRTSNLYKQTSDDAIIELNRIFDSLIVSLKSKEKLNNDW